MSARFIEVKRREAQAGYMLTRPEQMQAAMGELQWRDMFDGPMTSLRDTATSKIWELYLVQLRAFFV